MSGFGQWDRFYIGMTGPAKKYGDSITYQIAADFLADCEMVEDWGCGKGGFTLFYKGKYRGLDGSCTPWAHAVVDLCTYRSSVPGILLRHVLEHNHEWEQILANAVASFQKKLCVVLNTPMQPAEDKVIRARNPVIPVPDLALSRPKFESHLTGLKWRLQENIKTTSQQGAPKFADYLEHVYFVERP